MNQTLAKLIDVFAYPVIGIILGCFLMLVQKELGLLVLGAAAGSLLDLRAKSGKGYLMGAEE